MGSFLPNGAEDDLTRCGTIGVHWTKVVVQAVAETLSGRVRGRDLGGVVSFQGVPFAAAPRGEFRFLPPRPPEPWAGVRDAQQSGPAAPQFSLPAFSWINAAAGPLGDDCLSVNVWTPAADDARRPVLVWIHGGGFLVGSGSTAVYDGAALAERGDVVVVSINYRLGVLGFSHLGLLGLEGLEEATNVGIRDQIAALEWVRDNIERFGGDPKSVAIFGQSAGGMSVGTLLGAPRARPLFHRAICQSGAADHVIDRNEAADVAQILLRELGQRRPTPASLAEIPLGQLLAAQRAILTRASNLSNLMVLLPAVDGDLIPRQPLAALRAGEAAGIPIVTGATLDEWRLFRMIDHGIGRFSQADLVDRFREVLPSLPHAPRADVAARRFREALGERSVASRPSDVWSAFQSARTFHHPSNRLAEAHHAGGGEAYSYLFTWRAPAMRRSVGACHAIEIPFVFGSTSHPIARPLTGLSAKAGKLSRRLQHAWIGFARHGTPGHERLPRWPTYDPERRSTLIFGRDCALAESPLDEERQLIDRWLGDGPIRGRPLRHGSHNATRMRAHAWLGSPQTSDA